MAIIFGRSRLIVASISSCANTPPHAVDQQCPRVLGSEHAAVERHHLVHIGGELGVELALQGDRHRPQHPRIDVDRPRPHQQAWLGIELGKKLGRRSDLGGAFHAFRALMRLAQKLPPMRELASRAATARSVVRIPTIMSHPEPWPIFRMAATAWSAAPETTAETAQQRSAPRWPAAAVFSKHSLNAEVDPRGIAAIVRANAA